MIAMCMSMAPRRNTFTSAIRLATWELLLTTVSWCLEQAGGIQACGAATFGAAGHGPGDLDTNSATGVAAGSGGPWAITGGITGPRLSIGRFTNIGIHAREPPIGPGYTGT